MLNMALSGPRHAGQNFEPTVTKVVTEAGCAHGEPVRVLREGA